jgi:hypothetical protein
VTGTEVATLRAPVLDRWSICAAPPPGRRWGCGAQDGLLSLTGHSIPRAPPNPAATTASLHWQEPWRLLMGWLDAAPVRNKAPRRREAIQPSTPARTSRTWVAFALIATVIAETLALTIVAEISRLGLAVPGSITERMTRCQRAGMPLQSRPTPAPRALPDLDPAGKRHDHHPHPPG